MKAAPVADQGKVDLGDRRHAALRLVGRMICPLVRERVDIVHLLHRKRFLRDVLHDIHAVWIRLYQRPPVKRIRVVILYFEAFCILQLIRHHFIIGWQKLIVV